MQISNNYQASPNFGMAMILEKASRPAIEEGGMKMVNVIKRAQELVGDTKLVDLVIGEGAVPKIITPYADRYTKYFSVQKPEKLYPEYLKFETVWAGHHSGSLKPGDVFTASINLSNSIAAQRAYENISAEYNEIIKAAKITKLLDDKYVAQEAAYQAKIAEQEAVNKELDSLFEKFGEK